MRMIKYKQYTVARIMQFSGDKKFINSKNMRQLIAKVQINHRLHGGIWLTPNSVSFDIVLGYRTGFLYFSSFLTSLHILKLTWNVAPF